MDPITLAIASAAAGKAAETLTEQGRRAVAEIVRRIKERFQGNPAKLAILEGAKDDDAKIGELAVLLDEASAADPAFGGQIRALWNQAGVVAADGGVVNMFHGEAEKVIQLRDVHGDLNIS